MKVLHLIFITSIFLRKIMSNIFKTVGFIGKNNDIQPCSIIKDLCILVESHDSQALVEESTAERCQIGEYPRHSIDTLSQLCDLIVVAGGDGTLLCAARHIAQAGVPLVGVNQGRLGFLVDISPEKMTTMIEAILSGNYIREDRYLFTATVSRNGKQVYSADALNDVVLYKWNTASMVEFNTHIDDKFLLSQRSDGMIISTPTGSTAYALSGGGPLIHPAVNATLLVPICPHTLSNRPIVVGGNSKISINFKESSFPKAQITCDGQDCYTLSKEDTISITQKPEPIRLLHPPGYDYFNVLRAKLHWGGGQN
jgi:NAD+ kinase